MSEIEIADFLIMRGAEPESAIQVSALLAKKLDLLQYLSSVSSFSFVGEGFSDKSSERIDQVVSFLTSQLDIGHPFAVLIKSLAYQYMRTDRLWNYDGKNFSVNPRRHVIISVTDETIYDFLFKSLGGKSFNSEIYINMIRESIYVDPNKRAELRSDF